MDAIDNNRGGTSRKLKKNLQIDAVAMARYFSTDVLVDILQRLPPSSRRRARLVCRHWRKLVDTRTMEMQSRAKLLIWDTVMTKAYIVDDLSYGGWPRAFYRCHNKSLVGTCNGLLCLFSDERTSGNGAAVTLVNPSTGETLALYPPPRPHVFVGRNDPVRRSEQYNFAYHPITGRYTVVHLPGSSDPVCSFNVVHVVKLGEASWREVPVGPGGARCNLAAGLISIDGTTYWARATASGLAVEVVSFDLGDERAAATPLPTPLARDASYHLTEVHGRLGFVQGGHQDRADVWVLEAGRRWNLRYILGQSVPRPQFTFPGKCVLTMCYQSLFYAHWWKGQPSSSDRRLPQHDAMRIGPWDKWTLVVDMMNSKRISERYQTFAYVETKEPLNLYYG